MKKLPSNFRHFVAVEHLLDNTPLYYHSFVANDYRSLVSFNAFFRGMKKRNFSPEKWFSVFDNYGENDPNEWERYLTMMRSGVRLFPRISIAMTNHESIWNFYKAIGYDHKKNRWEQND